MSNKVASEKERLKLVQELESVYFTVKISWCKHWCFQMKRTDLDYDATPPCCTECLAMILLQTTKTASKLWIWGKKPQTTQTIEKELTASGILICIRWKPRQLCLLEQDWKGQTGNHRCGKLRFSFLGRCCIQIPGYGLKLLCICGSQVLQPLAIILFLPPTIYFFPWAHLTNHIF